MDELWICGPFGGGGTIATVEGGGSSTKFGSFNYALSIIANNTGQSLGQLSCAPFCGVGGDGLADITGSGDILGGEFLNHTEWTAGSDADAQVAPIPEPGSLALLGVGLAAAGMLRRASCSPSNRRQQSTVIRSPRKPGALCLSGSREHPGAHCWLSDQRRRVGGTRGHAIAIPSRSAAPRVPTARRRAGGTVVRAVPRRGRRCHRPSPIGNTRSSARTCVGPAKARSCCPPK